MRLYSAVIHIPVCLSNAHFGCNTSPYHLFMQLEIWKICILLCLCLMMQEHSLKYYCDMSFYAASGIHHYVPTSQLWNSNGIFIPVLQKKKLHTQNVRYVIIQYTNSYSYKRQEISIIPCRNCCMHAKRLLGRLLSELRLCAMCC